MSYQIGYVKLYRTIIDNEVYALPPLYLRVFERLIMEANHQDNEIPYKKNGIVTAKIIKRGEKLTSLRQISRWVGWYERGVFKEPNPKLIKEVLDYLVKREMLIIYDLGNRTETHYRVVNYSTYQDKEDTKVTEQKQKRNEVETDLKRLAPTNNNDKEGLKTNKNDNNDKKEEYIDLKFIDDTIDKVNITQEQYDKLINKFTRELVNRNIISLDNYIANGKGKKYKDHYRTLNTWCINSKKGDSNSSGNENYNKNVQAGIELLKKYENEEGGGNKKPIWEV